MTTVKVKFRPSTIDNHPGKIVYTITCHRIIRQITTDYQILPNEWNHTTSMPIQFAEDMKRTSYLRMIYRQIERDMAHINKIIEQFMRQNKNYSSDDIIDRFTQTKGKSSFFMFMENVIKRLQQISHKGTADNYRAALNSFRRFRRNEDIAIETIDKTIIEDYQTFLITTGITPNSVSFYMRILRAAYNRAVEQNLTYDCKPFSTVFTGMEKTRKRAISIRDIKRIKNLNLSFKPNLEFARDIFLFLFFCRGMSFIDAAFLKKKDIQNGILTYRRHKTNQILHIKVIRQISEIINRYYCNDSPWLLPIIINPDKEERTQYETALRRTNNALKEIAKMTKLQIPLTTYVSRHSWATIAKSKNIPINVISDALGHESISTTQIYLASFDMTTIDRANELITKDL